MPWQNRTSLGMWGQQFSNEVHERIVKQMRQKATNIVQKAVRLAPRDTNYLASSIHYEMNENDYTVSFIVGAFYGIFQEFGTRKMRPHPYLRPAINDEFGIYGWETSMAFQNVPHIYAPIIAHGKGFHLPSTLTRKQRGHVRKHLLPISKKMWSVKEGRKNVPSNVSRSKLEVRRGF